MRFALKNRTLNFQKNYCKRMKFRTILAAGAIALATSACKDQAKDVKLVTVEDSVSYSIGVDMAMQFKQGKMDTILNTAAIIKGIQDGMNKDTTKKPLIDAETGHNIMRVYFTNLQKKQQEDFLKGGEANKTAGLKFQEEFKKKPGVITTASGISYLPIAKGKGPKPSLNSVVKVHYTGKLIDGKVFDSSVQRGQPAEFPVSGVIKGWTEVLQLMSVGDKWQVVIPQELAYGDQVRQGDPIPPFSTLEFEIELLSISKETAK